METQPGYSAIVYGIMGLLACSRAEEEVARRGLRGVLEHTEPFGDDFSYAYMFLARLKERRGQWRAALQLLDRGIGMYAGKDFFCHGRLELEKARLLGTRDVEAGLALARQVRARALEAEATLLLNKAEALMRQLKRSDGAGHPVTVLTRPYGHPASAAARLVAEPSRRRTGVVVQ